MAIPFLLPLALTVGSTVANNIGARRVRRAQEDAMEAARIRQGRLDDEAFGINETMRERYDDFQGQQDQRQTDLAEYFTGQLEQAAPESTGALPVSDSNIVNSREATEMGKARDFVRGQGNTLAEMRAFGDLLGNISRDQARSAGDVNMLFGFQRGNANLLPLELEAASQRGNGMFMLGDILGGLGSVTMYPGLTAGGTAGLFGRNAAPAIPRASFANNAIPSLY